MGGGVKLVDGYVLGAVIGFPVKSGKQVTLKDDDVNGYYVALVRNGNKVSLRLFDGDPQNESGVVLDNLADLYSAVGGRLKAVLDLDLSTNMFQVSDKVWLSSGEKTVVIWPENSKNEACVTQVLEYMKQSQSDLVSAGGARKSLASRISRRISGKAGSNNRKNRGVSLKTPMKQMKMEELRSLRDILASKTYREEFRKYLRFSFASENLEFYEAVERFEAMRQTDKRRSMFADIINNYVREGSDNQVNLPAGQSRELMDILEKEENLDEDIFADSKREIYNLMERNFAHPFSVSIHKKEQREKQMQEMAGSFTKLWRMNGLDGFKGLYDSFAPEVERLDALNAFLEAFVQHLDQQIVSLQKLGAKFPVIRNGNSMPREHSLERILFQLFSGINKEVATLMELSHDIQNIAITPLSDLKATINSSLVTIHDTNLPGINKMNESRRALKDAIQKENEAYKAHVSAKKEIETSGKKPSKKQTSTLANLNAELEKVRNAREALEIKAIEEENKNADAMLSACDMLESLTLHRLDTERQALTQFALAERSAQTKIELATRAMLYDCMELDPIGEILHLVKQLENRK